MVHFVLEKCGTLIYTIVLLLFLALIPVRSETAVFSWTAHYTTRGKLVERVFNSTGHLEDCLVYGDRQLSEDTLRLIPRENQFMVNEDTFQAMVLTCSKLDPTGIQHHLRKKRQLIFPDTKWCGEGNISTGPNDLGSERELDKCCRSHDRCPQFIKPGKTKYRVTNTGLYSVTACSCDTKFRDCLRAVNKDSANTVGQIFFNILSLDCLKQVYPKVCTGWWIFKKCKPDYSKPAGLKIVSGYIGY